MLRSLTALRNSIFKRIQEMKTTDSWDTAGGLYVANFKQHLDVIASALSLTERQTIRSRFNTKGGCAELHNQSGYVFAQVRVYGEMCTPYEAEVTIFSSSKTIRKLFDVILPLRVEFFDTEKYEGLAA